MPVVAAVDRSERSASVVERAGELAEDSGLDLHVVHVGEAILPPPQSGYDPERADVVSAQKAKGIARKVATRVLGDGSFTPVGLQGDPAAELLAYLADVDAEYVVVSARKQSPIGQAVFGSVTQSLLLKADCPVVATPNTDR